MAEEKRRVLDSLEANACDWDERQLSINDMYNDPAVREGAIAYAARQAAYHRELKGKFYGI